MHPRQHCCDNKWNYALKLLYLVSHLGSNRKEICTCAGRNPHKSSVIIPEHHPYRPDNYSTQPATMWPIHAKRYDSNSLISRRCFHQPVDSNTALRLQRRAAVALYLNPNERKPRTHLLTSKGMMFARLTVRGLADKDTNNGQPYSSLQRYRLFIGTGLTSA